MLTVDDIIQEFRTKNSKPSDEELRQLPEKDALIYPRLSSPTQVKESHESMLEIIELVKLAKQDGYQCDLDIAVVEDMLLRIQQDVTHKEIITDGQITIDFRDLGISGRVSSDNRPGLKYLIESIKNGRTGAIYVSEASRLTRDQTRITPYTLLEVLKQNDCRVRTPEYINNPRIPGDWDKLADDLEKGIAENKVLNVRLLRKRRQKAQRGEFVGEPVIPGFIVDIKATEPSGRHIYGKYLRYAPHAEVVVRILREFIKQGFSETKTYRALSGIVFPLFPPELKYMERLSSLRMAKKVDGVGYLVTPSMITSLATTPELVGIWTWGDLEPKPDNHENAVPFDLWQESFQGYRDSVKPRGRSINYEPLEWSGLLWYENYGELRKVYHHSVKEEYRSQAEYDLECSQSGFGIAARYLDQPLTRAVLQKLNLTPFAEEMLMQLEADIAQSRFQYEERKNTIIRFERRIANLEEQLGWEDGKHDRRLLKQIEKAECDLNELKSQPVPVHSMPEINYKIVRELLTRLPDKWYNYSRTLRNRLLRRIIERVVLHQEGTMIEATIRWKTGQIQTIEIERTQRRRNCEKRWKKEEIDILKKLWTKAPREELLARLPGRTWKAIAHQASNLHLRRSTELSNHTPRRRWKYDEEERAKQLYGAGSSITDIASTIGRSYTAVLQRSWEKGWQRRYQDQSMAIAEFSNANQNPEDSKRITSGLVFGGQVKGIWSMVGKKKDNARPLG